MMKTKMMESSRHSVKKPFWRLLKLNKKSLLQAQKISRIAKQSETRNVDRPTEKIEKKVILLRRHLRKLKGKGRSLTEVEGEGVGGEGEEGGADEETGRRSQKVARLLRPSHLCLTSSRVRFLMLHLLLLKKRQRLLRGRNQKQTSLIKVKEKIIEMLGMVVEGEIMM